MKPLRPIQFAAFILVFSVYVALRFWRLTDSCLWFDEIFGVHAAEHSWNSLFSFVALDLIHPPLFYVLLKLWIAVGGESLFWLRLFPVLFAIVSLIPFVLFLRELKQNRWVEIVAIFLLAVNGSLIKYAQEVRMYSLLMCLAVFSMWLFARYFVRGKSFIPLVLVNLLLIYTHYFGWFIILSEIAAILIFQRIKWRRMLLLFAILLTCFMPWIYAVWSAAYSGSELGQNIGWMLRPKPYDIFQFLLDLIEPIYYQATNIEPASIYRISLPILLITVIILSLFFANYKQQNEVERANIKLLTLFAAVPLSVVFIISWLTPYSIWGTRHLIIVFPPLMILFAIAISNMQTHWMKTAAITLIMLFSGYAFILQATRPALQYSWCAWEPLAADAAAVPQANIYTFEDLVAYNIWFTTRNRRENQVVKVNGIDGLAEDKAYFLPRGFDDIAITNFNEITDARLWIAYRSRNIDLNEAPLRNFIVKGYRVIDQRTIEVTHESAILILMEK